MIHLGRSEMPLYKTLSIVKENTEIEKDLESDEEQGVKQVFES